MEKVKVAIADKGSVELSAKTQEKDFYSIWALKHNIHTLYKVSRLIFRCNNCIEAHSKGCINSKWATQVCLQGPMYVHLFVLVQHYHHRWAHSCGIWLWSISEDYKFINIVLLKSDTCTLRSTRYWLLLAVLSIFKCLYPCKRLWCLVSGRSFNSSFNWGSENELV